MAGTEAPGRKQLNVRLPADLHRALYAKATPNSGGVTEIVLRALRRELGIGDEAPVAGNLEQAIGEHEERIGDHERRLTEIEDIARRQAG